MQETLETWVQSLGQEDPLKEGKGNPLQYFCLENPMDQGAWWATVHGVTKSRTRLSNFTLTFFQSRLARTHSVYVYILSFFLIVLVLIAFFPPKVSLVEPFLEWGCRWRPALRGPLFLLSPSRGGGPALCSEGSLLSPAGSINKPRLCQTVSLHLAVSRPKQAPGIPGCSAQNALEGVGRG